MPGPDGTIVHSQLRLGGGGVGASSAIPDDGKNPWSAVEQGIYVCIPDPDAHYARAKSAGATIVHELADTPYGTRAYSAHDVEGKVWTFGTYQPTRSKASG